MSERNFIELIKARWNENKFVCVGLDTDLAKVPRVASLSGLNDEEARLAFNKAIIDATADLVCAYKPNPAFYEAQGAAGIVTLERTVAYIYERAPRVPIILDAKRGDIGNTNDGYAASAFDHMKADAITVHPYLGKESLQSLLDRRDKGIIVLARTSNPGAGEFQDQVVEGRPLYSYVAQRVAQEWNANGNCCLVAGGTYPAEIAEVRKAAPDLPFLIPGIGAQGGEVEATVVAAQDAKGQGMIINSSRGILFASSGDDYAEAARAATVALDAEIKAALNK